MKKYILALSVLFAVIIISIAACSKSSSSNPDPTPGGGNPPPTPPATTASVDIKNFAFSAPSIALKTGGTVTWTNSDAAAHTVTDNAGGFDSGNMATSATFSHKFTTAGTYSYKCTIHSTMTGKVVVTD
jgi:plastocyanin